jgi:hypothetical protein
LEHPYPILAATKILPQAYGYAARDIETWKKEIRLYAKRHYGIDTWWLHPTTIVLHITEADYFPDNLLTSTEFNGEKPGVASHFVVYHHKGNVEVLQLLPLNVMSRATFGANYCSISIEIVARNEAELLSDTALMEKTAELVKELMRKYKIKKIYGHNEVDVALRDKSNPLFFDRTPKPKRPMKTDPGYRVLDRIRTMAQE